jgi:hypothetical protein
VSLLQLLLMCVGVYVLQACLVMLVNSTTLGGDVQLLLHAIGPDGPSVLLYLRF